MAFFSLKEGRPIAKIQGGKKNGKIIYLLDENHKDYPKKKEIIYLDNNSLLKGLEEDIRNLFTGVRKDVEILDGTLIPFPRSDKRETLYISGPEGSGKSTYAGLYIEQFKKKFPKRDFFVFSKKNEDPAFDKFKPKRIELNEDLVDNPIEPEELMCSIVLFDDIGTISNKKVGNAVKLLRDSILEVGRSDDIYIISTTHNLTNSGDTKMSLLESSSVTFFPKMGDSFHINRFLKEYCGLKKDQIERIYNLNSRWVTIYKRAPMYILYEHGCYFL